MILLECSGPFQWKPSYVRFGEFRRVMWGWFAVSHFDGGINEMIEGIGRAGASLYAQEQMKPSDTAH